MYVRDLEIRGGANKIVTGPMEGKAKSRLGKIPRTNLNFMNVIKTSWRGKPSDKDPEDKPEFHTAVEFHIDDQDHL